MLQGGEGGSPGWSGYCIIVRGLDLRDPFSLVGEERRGGFGSGAGIPRTEYREPRRPYYLVTVRWNGRAILSMPPKGEERRLLPYIVVLSQASQYA